MAEERTVTMAIKIPISIAQRMDDRGQLNPQFTDYFLNRSCKLFVDDYLEGTSGFWDNDYLDELQYTYTFKVNMKTLIKVRKTCQMSGYSAVTVFCQVLFYQYYDKVGAEEWQSN